MPYIPRKSLDIDHRETSQPLWKLHPWLFPSNQSWKHLKSSLQTSRKLCTSSQGGMVLFRTVFEECGVFGWAWWLLMQKSFVSTANVFQYIQFLHCKSPSIQYPWECTHRHRGSHEQNLCGSQRHQQRFLCILSGPISCDSAGWGNGYLPSDHYHHTPSQCYPKGNHKAHHLNSSFACQPTHLWSRETGSTWWYASFPKPASGMAGGSRWQEIILYRKTSRSLLSPTCSDQQGHSSD